MLTAIGMLSPATTDLLACVRGYMRRSKSTPLVITLAPFGRGDVINLRFFQELDCVSLRVVYFEARLGKLAMVEPYYGDEEIWESLEVLASDFLGPHGYAELAYELWIFPKAGTLLTYSSFTYCSSASRSLCSVQP